MAAAIADPRARERVVQMMLMTALADEAVSPREAAVVADFARELGIDEPRVDSLRLLSEGHVARTWLGLARRGSARVEVAAPDDPGAVLYLTQFRFNLVFT